MKITLFVLLGALMLLMVLALWQGVDTFKQGISTSVTQLSMFLPVLTIAVLLAGFTETLLPSHLVEQWLSDASGWRGIGLAWLAGILTPGGSIVGLPLVAALYKSGVGLSVLMTYATSLATLSLLRIPLEVGFYGWKLTGLRVLVSLLLPIIAGVTTQWVVGLVNR